MTLFRLFCVALIIGGIIAAISTGVMSWLWLSVIGAVLFFITLDGGSSGGGSGSDFVFIDSCDCGDD